MEQWIIRAAWTVAGMYIGAGVFGFVFLRETKKEARHENE